MKDKSLGSNPALAFHKKNKKDSINKSRAEKSKLRDTQLQRRRPDQVEKQIDELRLLAQSGKISAQDRRNLESLEKDLARINKLRAEGKAGPIVTSEKTKRRDERDDKKATRIPKDPKRSYYYDPIYNPYGVPPPGMPYREVDPDDSADSDSSTTSSIARIPMPPGTPPPLSSPGKSSSRRNNAREAGGGRMMTSDRGSSQITDHETKHDTQSIVTPAAEVSRTTYDSAPVMRNLKQEAATFVPKSLKRKLPLVGTKGHEDHVRDKQVRLARDPLEISFEGGELENTASKGPHRVGDRLKVEGSALNLASSSDEQVAHEANIEHHESPKIASPGRDQPALTRRRLNIAPTVD